VVPKLYLHWLKRLIGPAMGRMYSGGTTQAPSLPLMVALKDADSPFGNDRNHFALLPGVLGWAKHPGVRYMTQLA